MIWECRLARPFSLNNAYVNGPHRRHYSPQYSAWRREAKADIMAQGRRPRFKFAEVTIHVCSGILTKRQDLDNLAKPIVDVLVNMHVFPDDTWQVVRSVTVRVWERKAGEPDPHPAMVCVEVMGCPAD